LGTELQLTSNFFRVLSTPTVHFLQYHVVFKPEMELIALRMGLLKQHADLLGKHLYNGSVLYCTAKLPQPMKLKSNLRSDGSTVEMEFTLVGEVTKEDGNYVSLMNSIIRQCLKLLDLTMIKRNYYDAREALRMPEHEIDIWPGYLSTIHRHEKEYLLGVEIVHKIVRQDTALNIIEKIRNQASRENRNDLTWERIKVALEGQVVMTHYNNRTYRIDEVTEKFNPQSEFHLRKEDRLVTYLEYYEKRYHLKVKNKSQPMLISRPTRRDVNRGDDKPIFLIPELCLMTGLSESMRNDDGVRQAIANKMRVAPDSRVQNLLKFRRRLQDNDGIQRELSQWGLQLASDLVTCKGRTLEHEIKIVSQHDTFPIRGNDWTREMYNRSMAVPKKMNNWLVLVPNFLSQDIRRFITEMTNCGRTQGFAIENPKIVEMKGISIDDYRKALQEECEICSYNIVMVVCRGKRSDVYNMLKQLACCTIGIPIQVITDTILKKSGKSIPTKVMIQMAAKLGAEPWRISGSPLPTEGKKWMVIGYDTYHDAKQNRAVGAFVASINDSFTRYASSVKVHENNEELSPNFNYHFQKCLEAYRQAQNCYPTDIFFYRDGVGAGDIDRVKEFELGTLKETCRQLSVRHDDFTIPRIAFIIVSKRIGTRFFHPTSRGANNPPCGTVVDNTVTLFERFDFFLVSQKASRGTVSPTSFNVIEDDTKMTPDDHQKLAYALTHLYYNWTGNLRVPAPIQYAHKLAYLVGEGNFNGDHKPHLTNLPYYL